MVNDPSIDPRLIRRLGGTELAGLRQRMRRHFERHGRAPERTGFHLTNLSAVEYEALALLIGLPPRSTRSVRIDIARFDAALQDAGMANSLHEALEKLDGPIVNRAEAKAELQSRWSSVTNDQGLHPALCEWLRGAPAVNLLKRVSKQAPQAAHQLLQQAHAVMRRLPAQGLTRAQLAADVLGNAHALDNGQAVATVVLAALQHGANDDELEQPPSEGTTEEADGARRPAERVRDIWARSGVLVNELARPALFLNLPVRPPSALLAAPGEPGYLSLRRLLRTPPAWDVANHIIYVCENPNIVSIAADRLGAACAPLVCTDGMPAAAQRVLLKQLAGAGAKLLYHGDFDWAGIHIANNVMRLCDARSWRFGAEDYVQAVETTPPKGRDLEETRVAASWDHVLIEAMQSHGMAIAEEAVASLLVNDLRQ
ncbi:TIGR02679 family protein [Hydrogenophaga crassostreae]|uniref:TIGR02679 family protein n=1 Tax=Hydrogenophaga crassostreae TaxID=1763535 RepID=A0A162N0W2_9BURK|nr:TIGR02679 family protein [Hydrogenophaga crassostreae]AOW13980.1 TIGR02679 family protein [Hydrogenophaga crassostreae]OAD44055.1 TIGR02679 family protein [Hydrogenophaga crassostreae]